MSSTNNSNEEVSIETVEAKVSSDVKKDGAVSSRRGSRRSSSIVVVEKTTPTVREHIAENHGGLGSDRIKSVVFGGLDGVITTFSIVSAVAGASLSIETALLMGFSNLIADGISMGLGDFLSSKAELEYEESESKREMKEFELNPEDEINEQIELFREKGVTEGDAKLLSNTLAQYPDIFHKFHLRSELGLSPPEGDEAPAVDGSVTFFSFLLFGSVPMWTYLITFYAGYRSKNGIFGIACATTVMTMFFLGVTQAVITRQNRLKTGILMTINGSIAAASAYLVGWALEHAIGSGNE
jgi:VIT1/CCC1 family predicted Fe2+/Mn2+ transporter